MANRYWVGGTGNWDAADTSHWSATSGGAGGASVPTASDDVFFDASSGAGTATLGAQGNTRNLDCTGYTGTLAQGNYHLFTNPTAGGVVKLAAGMTYTSAIGYIVIQSAAGANSTLTTAGKTLYAVTFQSAATGGVTLADSLSVGSGNANATIQVGAGTFNSNGYAVTTCGDFVSVGSSTRAVTLGSSVVTIGRHWSVTATGLTLSAASASIVQVVQPVGAPTTFFQFNGGGFTYGTATYTTPNYPLPLQVTGANTFTTLNVGPGRTLTFPASTTNTVTNWNVNGTVNGYCYLPGNGTSNLSTPDSAAVSITGDLDIRVRVALDKWSGMANNATLVDKVDYAANSSYQFAVLNDGSMFAYVSHTGAGLPESATSTANLSATADGATLWVRMTYRASDGRVQFFKASGSLTAAVAADFTQVGADRFTATSGAIFDGNRAVGIGDGVGGTPYPAKGKFYRVQLRNGLDGTLAFDADLTTVAPGVSTFTESSANAATVTLNGMAQQGMGCVCINSSTGGTAATVSKASGAVLSDYVTVQDIAATGGATWNAGAFGRSVSGNSGWAFNTVTANLGVTGNWNANGTWYGGVQPTAANNVAIPPTATVTIPAATTALGRSLSEYGTLIFASDTTSVLTLGDATAGAGNRAFYAPKNVETNLAPNPNAELDAANWASWYLGHASAVTRSTTQAYSGSASIRMVPDGTTPFLGADCGFTGVVGKRYSVSCAFRAPTTGSFTMDLRDWPSVWSYVADQGYVSMQAGEWRVFTWTNISPAAGSPPPWSAWVVNTQIITGNFTASVPVYLDNLMIAESATPVPYFDGSTTATVDYTYAWTGAANASTSTRTLNRSSNITLTGMGVINFVSTSATQQTITTGTKQLPSYSITGVGSSYLLTDANTAVGQVTLLNGTLDTGSQVCVWGWFTSNVGNVRTLTMGASRITVTISGNAWYSTGINLTVTANTAVITMSGTNLNPNPVDYTQFVEGSTCNYNGASIVMAGIGQFMTCGNITVANLTRTGGAVKTDVLSLNGGSLTVTGTLTVNGNSATNRMMVRSNSGAVAALGTPITVTAAAVAASNVDWQDIVAAGAANWNLSAIAGGAGDCGGNAGITFTASATQTHTASAGGSWSDVSKWTSRVPLPQDDVVVNASTTGTLTADMPRMGKSINFTGFAGVCTLGSDVTSYGSLTLASGMTVGGVFAWTFAGRSACSLTSAGKVFPQNLFVSAPGGTVTLQDALSGGYVVLLAGTFNTNNQGVTCTGLADNNSTAARTWTFGTSTVTLTGVAGANMMYATSSGCTMNAASATFVVSVASASTRAFVGAGFSYGTLRYTVASSPGSLTITGANTFGTLDIGPGRPLILPSSTTTTVTNMNAAGVPNGYTYLPGTTTNYLSSPDSAALSITGDIDIRVRLSANDWTPAGLSPMLVSKTASPYAFDLYMGATGAFVLRTSPDGSALSSATSAVPSFVDGSTYWVRVTRVASTGVVVFYTAADSASMPSSWTTLTTTANTAGAIFDSTCALEVGSNGGGTNTWAGKLYRAQIRSNILDDGTGIVFDADLTTKTCGARSFTESALGATVTINGASAQAGDGSVNLSSSTPGTPATLSKASGSVVADFLSVSDSTATGGAIFFARASGINAGGNTGWVFGTSPKQGASNWNVDSTWSKGVQPTAADWVVIPSGANVTIPGSVTALARSLRVLAGGTLSYASAPGSVLTLGDATADLFNEAVAISASATINAAAGYGLLGFASTSGTVQTIESGGKTLPGLTFNGAGSSYRLSDASVSNGTVTLLRGTFDTNSMACSWDAFTTTGALVRSLLLGTSQVTVASAGTAWHAALTGLTLVAGGSTITVSHAESPTFSGGGATYGTVVFAEAGTPVIAGAGTTFANLTRTGTPVQTDALALAADIVVTGTLGLTGQSIVNRILFCSDTLGVQRRVTAALVVAVNADFRDINADGAFLWDLTAALGGAGDLGNNTGILFVLVGPRVQVGGNPFDVANLAIPDSRVAWSQLSTAGVAEVAVCGWHGTRFAPEVGAYAIVSSTGPLADLVGELVRVQAGSNDVFVYVYSDGDVAEDISLTRRAFMELAELWTEELPVKVTVIAGASQ